MMPHGSSVEQGSPSCSRGMRSSEPKKRDRGGKEEDVDGKPSGDGGGDQERAIDPAQLDTQEFCAW
jgi:hypothetical protein